LKNSNSRKIKEDYQVEEPNRINLNFSKKTILSNELDQSMMDSHETNNLVNLSIEEISNAVYTGIISGLYRGPVLGFPITKLSINVHSLRLFGAESTKAAISTCASQALTDALKGRNLVLLEPLMNVNIDVPEEYLGDVLGDLTGIRRGNVLGLETSENIHNNFDRGTASFDMRVLSFGVMSDDRAKAVIREMKANVNMRSEKANENHEL
ncbi:1484_t:CDS:2, partial [Scutellospora calospora]